MKKIGIVAWKDGNHFGISISYATYLSKFGQVIPILPSNQVIEDLDLLILPGGPDLSPTSLNVPPTFANSFICPFREYFYKNVLSKYIERKIPVFGICLGFQQLNVHFGGGLTLDHPFNYSSKSRDEKVDKAIITELGLKYHKQFYPNYPHKLPKDYDINSLHHQGVKENEIAPTFDIISTTNTYGFINVEAFVHKTLPIAGVQYHPEELGFDWFANGMIKNLLNTKK